MLRAVFFLFAGSLVSVLLATGCETASEPSRADAGNASAEERNDRSSAREAGEEGGASRARGDADSELRRLGEVPAFTLTDQLGRTVSSYQLEGKVSVYNFFFTRCAATCPMQTAQLHKLQEQLADEAIWEDVRFLSVSVDPEHDTPDVLNEYAQSHSADGDHWMFLTGSRPAVWKLSKEGFKLPAGERPADESMPIFHSSKLVLVDRQGQIRGYYEALADEDVEHLLADLRQLAAQEAAVPENPFASRGTAGGESAAEAEEDLSELSEEVAGAFAEQVSPTGSASETPAQESLGDVRNVYVPSRRALFPEWLEQRAAEQEGAMEGVDVYHDFRFRDRLPESGITFVNEVVDDAGKTYKAAHYDHGNGVSIADVDGDGRYDIYFTTQLGGNALYRNLGDGTFEDITEAAGVGLPDRISVTSSFADVDNDGDPDLFVTTVRDGNVLFENEGGGRFRDITAEAGLEYVGHSSAGVFFDFNRDGLLDLFLTNVGRYTTEEVGRGDYYIARPDAFAGHLKPELSEASILYKNLGNKRFQDVCQEVQLVDESWSGDAAPLDFNRDGWIDLYVLNMQGHDEFYENREGTRFERHSREVFPKTPWGAMGIQVFDFDRDGLQDIYITDMHSDMSERIGIDREKLKADMKFPESMLQSGGLSIFGNAFYRQASAGQYAEISDEIGAENYWPWGLSAGDLNADGFDDVFIASSMNLPFRYGVNSVLLNDHGKRFVDSEFVLGVEPRRDGRTCKPWFELDCDGPDRDHPYARQANIDSGRAVVWGALGSRSSVIFDLDEDGDLDVVTNDFNSEPMVLASNLAEKRAIRYIQIKLVGTNSNRDGLGAKVQVVTSEGSQTKIHDGQSGYLSQSSYPLYFGLGRAESIESIHITWPSGVQQELRGPIDINRLLTVDERD